MPKTTLGSWSVSLLALMPVLFICGAYAAGSLYRSVPAGTTILEDLMQRPALALAMGAGMLSGIMAFILGGIAVVRHQERAPLVYAAIAIGALLIVFLVGEVLFPH